MKVFFKNIILFLILGLIVGEAISRVKHLSSDIPQREIDADGIQKYIPNQSGYWKGGGHKWNINKLGWPGLLPDSYDNLITIIGDSFIENFMNPNECHQSVYLKNKLPRYNFFEASRSGVSFIEAMEISEQLKSYKPVLQLVYVTDSDFIESIRELQIHSDITQLNLEKNKIEFGSLKSAKLKKILYNWKFMYYLYNRFNLGANPLSLSKNEIIPPDENNESDNENKTIKRVGELLNYVKLNYEIKNHVLVFHPDSDNEIIDQAQHYGFKTILLSTEGERISWTFDHDKHWTCYGHEKVAEQVAKKVLN